MRRILSMLAVITVAGCGAMPDGSGVTPLAPEAVTLRTPPPAARRLPSCEGVAPQGRIVLVPLPDGRIRVEDDGVPVCADTGPAVMAAGLFEDAAPATLSGPTPRPRIFSYGAGNSDPMPADGEHGVENTGGGTAPGGGTGTGGGTTSSDPMPATGGR